MGKRKVGGLGELAALENTVVDQGIMHDEIGFAEEMADRGHVGGVARLQRQDCPAVPINSAISCSSSRCSGLSPEASRLADTEVPVTVDGVFGGLCYDRISGHTQIVVPGENDEIPAFRNGA